MGFWMMFFVWIASMIASALLAEKPKYENAKAANEDEASFPTIDPTKHVPVVWGKVRLRQSMVAWYGDFGTKKITKKYETKGFLGFGGSSQTVTVGFEYYWGQHLACCHGSATLHRIWLEELVIWTGSASGVTNIAVSNEGAYGGKERGGGYRANLVYYPGNGLNERDPYLIARLGAEVPGYRNIANLVWIGPSGLGQSYQEWVVVVEHYWEGLEYRSRVVRKLVTKTNMSGYIGTTPQPKPLSVEVSRYPNLLGSSNDGKIGDDANAAEIIYECLTNREWGQSVPTTLVDTAAFQAAATKFYNEGFGLSLAWDQEGHIDEVVKRICSIVDAQVYRDFRTGKFTIKLIRGGYDVDTLPVLDTSNVNEITDYTVTTFDGTANEIAINYVSRATGYLEAQRVAQDQGNVNIQNDVVSKSLDMPEIKLASLADRVAWRELNARSQPFAKIELIADRESYAYGPGDLFKLTWAPLGISSMAVRVVKAAVGLPKDGKIRLTVMQDVFDLPNTAFVDGGDPDWTDPVPAPIAVVNQTIIELPYFFNQSTDMPQYVYVCAKPNEGSLGADIYGMVGSGAYSMLGSIATFTPTATLRDNYDATSMTDLSDTLVLENLNGVYALQFTTDNGIRSGLNLAYFETTGEWIGFSNVLFTSDTTITLEGVWRGLFNTGNQPHSAGERIWFVSDGQFFIPDSVIANYGAGISLGTSIQARTTGPRGALTEAQASTISKNPPSVAAAMPGRPNPPGYLQVNNAEWTTRVGASVDLTGVHRNKAELPTGTVTAQFDPATATADGTYTVEFVRGDTLAVLRTVSGLATPSTTYTAVQRLADYGSTTLPVYARWRAVSAGKNSQYNYAKPFFMTGLGIGLGMYLGGLNS